MNGLWERIEEQARKALAQGALHRIETEATFIEEGGVEFVCRRATSLERKHAAREEGNPFLRPEEALLVADVSPTHYALLNKYNVMERHLLVVTRAYADQDELLDDADFEALAACMREPGVLGFYNGGAAAGASQPHKHLQVVKLPLSPRRAIPMEALVERDALATLPFKVAFAWHGGKPGVDLYRELMGPYRGPYNLVVTDRWMLFVPRTSAAFEGIEANSLAFAGALFVRDAAGLETLRRIGPLALLAGVAHPKD